MATKRPKPPKDLSPDAVAEWKRVTRELASRGTLREEDRGILTVYCRIFAIHHDAVKALDKDGAYATYSNGNRGTSAAYKVMHQTSIQLRNLLSDLGLTPASRPAIAAVTPTQPDKLVW